MELSHEDHLEAKAHTETLILLGQCKREKQPGPNGLWNLLPWIFGSLTSREMESGTEGKTQEYI
jgi:hypothetical protein